MDRAYFSFIYSTADGERGRHLAWARGNDGLLSAGDYFRLVAQGVRMELEMAAGRLRRLLGFTPAMDGARRPCFTIASVAELARVDAVKRWPEGRRDRAAEAITIHMNLGVRPKEGVEGYLVNAGAQMDVIGRRH